MFCPFGWCARLPVSFVLYEWYPVSASAVPDPYEYWFAFASNQHILFPVYCHPLFREDGECAVIGCLANAHE